MEDREDFRPEAEYPVVSAPVDPGFGENHAFWLFDQKEGYHFCLHLNSVEAFWPLRRETLSILLPGGRALVEINDGGLTRERKPGGANLWFECIDPFRRWIGGYQGVMQETSLQELAQGTLQEGRRSIVRFNFSVEVVTPPWTQGSRSGQTALTTEHDASRFIGGLRYEQLCRHKTSLTIGDEPTVTFEGTCLRTHRQGTRSTSQMAGHSWQTALFEDGRAFGLMRFPDAAGNVIWGEAFVRLSDGSLHDAKIIQSPWLRNSHSSGESFTIHLETAIGSFAIQGEVLAQSFRPFTAPLERRWGMSQNADTLMLAAGVARYTWDDLSEAGLVERSAPRSFLI